MRKELHPSMQSLHIPYLIEPWTYISNALWDVSRKGEARRSSPKALTSCFCHSWNHGCPWQVIARGNAKKVYALSASSRVVPKKMRSGWLPEASLRFEIVVDLHFAAPNRFDLLSLYSSTRIPGLICSHFTLPLESQVWFALTYFTLPALISVTLFYHGWSVTEFVWTFVLEVKHPVPLPPLRLGRLHV